MVKNQNGSVLSVAVVIIFLLSFALSTTTVYTADVMNRTNVIVSNNDENTFGRFVIRALLQSVKDEVSIISNDETVEFPAGFKTQLEVMKENLIESVEDLVEGFYSTDIDVEDIVDIEFESTANVLIARVSFKTQANNVITRELLIQPSTSTNGSGGVNGDVTDFDSFLDTFIDCQPTTENNECGGQTFDYINSNQNVFVSSDEGFGTYQARNLRNIIMDKNAYVDNSNGTLTIESTAAGGGAGQSRRIDLNGNTLIIEGSLNLIGITTIRSGDGDGEYQVDMGVIIIGGNLDIDATSLQIINTLIIVQGTIYANNLPSLDTWDNDNGGHIITINTSNWPLSGPDLSSRTYNTLINNNKYRYVGSNPNFSFSDLPERFNIDNEFDGFNFIEGSFTVTQSE